MSSRMYRGLERAQLNQVLYIKGGHYLTGLWQDARLEGPGGRGQRAGGQDQLGQEVNR